MKATRCRPPATGRPAPRALSSCSIGVPAVGRPGWVSATGGFGEAICSTRCAARTLILTLARWDARRSRSNASSGPHRFWAITMPLACSITGMVSSLACSRANAESCRTSRWDRPFMLCSRVARKRALTCSNRSAWASNSRGTSTSRSVCACWEPSGPGSTMVTLPGVSPSGSGGGYGQAAAPRVVRRDICGRSMRLLARLCGSRIRLRPHPLEAA